MVSPKSQKGLVSTDTLYNVYQLLACVFRAVPTHIQIADLRAKVFELTDKKTKKEVQHITQ